MNQQLLRIALINIGSIFYLALVVAGMFSLAEHNDARKIITVTLRRWLKLIGALLVLGIIVHILSNFY